MRSRLGLRGPNPVSASHRITGSQIPLEKYPQRRISPQNKQWKMPHPTGTFTEAQRAAGSGARAPPPASVPLPHSAS